MTTSTETIANCFSVPEQVLPDPSRLADTVAVDTETSGLYPDEGARICAVSLAFRTLDEPDRIQTFAFPFDQGRYLDKGFEIQRLKNGLPRGMAAESDLDEWTADHNLDPKHWRWLLDWLVAAGRRVGHSYQNAAFDLLMFDAGLRTGEPGVWLEPFVLWDTMLASKNLWPTQLTGLKPTAARIWGEAEVAEAQAVKDALAAGKKLFGLRAEHGPRYDLIPWSINGPYAAQDTMLTARLREHQWGCLDSGEGIGWSKFSKEMDLMRTLTRMSRRGFGPYAGEQSHEWANVLAGRQTWLERKLPFVLQGDLPSDSPVPVDEETGRPMLVPKGATAARATEFYFEVHGLRPWKIGEGKRGFEVGRGHSKKFVPGTREDKADIVRRFPGEEVVFKQGSLTADIAQRLGDAGAPGATMYAELLRLRIANQMFYRNYADLAGQDAKLRTVFRQAHVKSGRMSVERFQAQALPKKLRLECDGFPVPEPRAFFQVPQGRRRWNLDLSQAELRIASHLSGCELMYKALDGGLDLHGQTCERTFQIDPNHPDWKGKRDVAKRLNFGGIFRIGAITFRENLWLQGGIEWSHKQCKDAVDAFRETYPEIGKAYEDWMRFAERYGCVELYNGERSYLGRFDYPNTAWSRVVQGSLASWVAEWLVLVEQMTQKDEALVLSVHDSAVLDLPQDRDEDEVKRIVALSEELWFDRFGFPGRVDFDPWTYHEGVDLSVPQELTDRYALVPAPVIDNEENC